MSTFTPLRPIRMPGRAAWTNTVSDSSPRSISTNEMPACLYSRRTKRRIFSSSMTSRPKSFLEADQRERQLIALLVTMPTSERRRSPGILIPTRNAVGMHFWPIP